MKNNIFLLILILLSIAAPPLIAGAETEESLYIQGLHSYITRDFKSAVDEWRATLELNPNHEKARDGMEKAYKKYNIMETHYYRGLSYFKKTEYTNAIPEFKHTLMINPRHEKALFYLNLCYQMLEQDDMLDEAERTQSMAEQLFADGELRKAQALYQVLLMLEPDNMEAKLRLAELDELINEENRKNEIALHVSRAQQYEEAGKYKEALQAYSAAQQLQPDNQETQRVINNGIQRTRSKLEEQKKEAKIAELITQGDTAFSVDDLNTAKNRYTEVLGIDPENKPAQQRLHNVNKRRQELEEQKLLAADAQQQFEFGKIKYNEGDEKQTAAELKNALKSFQTAYDRFETASNLNPTLTNAITYLSYTRDRIDFVATALEKKNRELVEQYLKTGIEYYKVEDWRNAISQFEKVLEIDPENTIAIEFLNLARREQLYFDNERVSEDSPYYEIVAELLRNGKQAFSKQQYEVSEYFFNQILALFPRHGLSQEYLLRILYKTDKNEFDATVTRTLEDGKELLSQKKYKPALRKFQLIKKLAPDYPDIDTWISRCNPPSPIDPAMIESKYNEGVALYNTGNYPQAISAWQTVIAMDKNPSRNRRFSDAVIYIQRARARLSGTSSKTVSYGSGNAESRSLYYKGVSEYNRGNYKQAIALWEKVLRIDPNHADARRNINRARARLEQINN